MRTGLLVGVYFVVHNTHPHRFPITYSHLAEMQGLSSLSSQEDE